MTLAHRLGRAAAGLIDTLKGHTPPTARPAAAPATPPSWRDARQDSVTLRQAVEAMEGHADLLAQLGDAWLLSANLKQFDVQRFYANVARSRDIATALDEDCAAVIAEVRALERQRDSADQLEAQGQRTQRYADRLGLANRVLRDRLTVLAQAQGLDFDTVLMDAAKRCARTERAELDALVLAHQDEQPVRLEEWLT